MFYVRGPRYAEVSFHWKSDFGWGLLGGSSAGGYSNVKLDANGEGVIDLDVGSGYVASKIYVNGQTFAQDYHVYNGALVLIG